MNDKDLEKIEKYLLLRKTERRNEAQKPAGLFITFFGLGFSLYNLFALSDEIGSILGLILGLFGFLLLIDWNAYSTRLELINKGIIKGRYYDLD